MNPHTNHSPADSHLNSPFLCKAWPRAIVLAGMIATGSVASAQPQFTHHTIPSANTIGEIFPTDLDGDGDTDLVVASGFGAGLSWLESNGATPPSFTTHEIDTIAMESVFVADIDGDGDLDIAAGSSANEFGLGWFENIGGDAPAFQRYRLEYGSNSTSYISYSHLFVVDMDADGTLDIVSRYFSYRLSDPEMRFSRVWVSIYEELFYSNFESGREIYEYGSSNRRHSIPFFGADLDGDGDTDLVGIEDKFDGGGIGWVSNSKVVWIENDGKVTPSFTVHAISSTATSDASSGFGADADGDGDTDLFLTYPDERMLRWFENDGSGNFATENTVPFDSSVQDVFATDLDADGDNDLVTVSGPDDNGEVWWHENDGDDIPTFTPRPLLVNGTVSNSPFAADMNRDGNIDILSTDGSQLNWFAGGGDARVQNVTRDWEYLTIETALARADDYDQFLAPAALFGAETLIDFRDTPVTLTSTASILQFPGSRCILTDGARLESSPPSFFSLGGARIPSSTSSDRIDMAGELRVDTEATADITTRTLAMEPGSMLNVRDIARLFVAADASLDGTTRVDRGAMLSIDGDTTGNGSIRVLDHGVMMTAGSFYFQGDALVTNANLESFGPMSFDSLDSTVVFHNATIAASELTIATPTSSAVVSGSIFAPVVNYGSITCVGDTLAVGDYENIGTTTVQIGTLQVIGSLYNMGTLVGDVQSTRSLIDSTQPGDGFAITGSYTVGPDASLVFPDPVWRLSVGGNFDVQITSSSRIDLRMAEVRLNGSTTQSVETMSTDIGPDQAGLDRTVAGHAPMGTLRIATGSTVTLVDAHDNDVAGQATPEAVYTETLIVEAGATLNTAGHKVYYQSMQLSGSVDDPTNLVEVGQRCSVDLNLDGVLDLGDINTFVMLFLASDLAVDMNEDGILDLGDISTFVALFLAGC